MVYNAPLRARFNPYTTEALRTVLLLLHRDGLQFEMPAPQERSRPDEFPRRQIFRREVALVNGIEFLEQGKVRARDLHVHQVVHGHPCLRQYRLLSVQQVLDLVLNFFRRLSRLGVQSKPPRQVKCIPRKNRIAERELRRFIRKVDGLSRWLYRHLRKRTSHRDNSRNCQYHQKTDATIHTLPPFE